MKLKHKDGCGHEWDYKGKSKVYATCPGCQKKIKISSSRMTGSRS